jgi:hypothetical protein
MAAHGSLTEYRSGCRCPKCTAANREQKRRLRAAKPDKPPNVVSLPTTVQPAAAPKEPGPNEVAVRAECEILPKAAERPAIVAAAISVAQRLDDPAHAAMVARNSKELRDLLSELKGPKRKSGGRLATVSAMSNRRPKAI